MWLHPYSAHDKYKPWQSELMHSYLQECLPPPILWDILPRWRHALNGKLSIGDPTKHSMNNAKEINISMQTGEKSFFIQSDYSSPLMSGEGMTSCTQCGHSRSLGHDPIYKRQVISTTIIDSISLINMLTRRPHKHLNYMLMNRIPTGASLIAKWKLLFWLLQLRERERKLAHTTIPLIHLT